MRTSPSLDVQGTFLLCSLRVSFWRVLSSMEQHKCQLENGKVTFMTCLGGNMHSFFEKGSRLKNFSFPKLSKTWHGEIKIMLLAGTNLSQSIEGRLVELFCAKVGLSWFDLREYNQTVECGRLTYTHTVDNAPHHLQVDTSHVHCGSTNLRTACPYAMPQVWLPGESPLRVSPDTSRGLFFVKKTCATLILFGIIYTNQGSHILLIH